VHVPNELAQVLLRDSRYLITEVPSVSPLNRAWVKLGIVRDSIGKARLEKPDAPLYFLRRFELPRSLLEDEMHTLHEPDYFEHVEYFGTQDIAEAFEKAAEYESDWSKWGTYKMHPDCP
jgi:hypothetical protein